MLDLTRNIQRKKEKEMAALQFVAAAIDRCKNRSSKARKSAATILARAAAERSTKNAAELLGNFQEAEEAKEAKERRKEERGHSGSSASLASLASLASSASYHLVKPRIKPSGTSTA